MGMEVEGVCETASLMQSAERRCSRAVLLDDMRPQASQLTC